MEQDQVGRDDDRASVGGGASSLDFNFLVDHEEGTETLAGATEPEEDETSTLEPPSAFMDITHNLPAISSPGKTKTIIKTFLTESTRSRRIEGAARVPFIDLFDDQDKERIDNHRSKAEVELTRVNEPARF